MDSYKSQIEQIITLLKPEKTRKASLDILLSLSESQDLIPIFRELELPKILLRLLESDEIKEKELILQILINYSTNELYLPELLSLNIFHRIIKIIFDILETSYKSSSNTTTIDNPDDIIIGADNSDLFTNSSNKNELNSNLNIFNIKKELDKYVINSESINNVHSEIKQENVLVNLYFILMANLTSFEPGQKKILDVDNEKIKGIIFFKLLDKYFEFVYNNSFNFCSNLIVNVSSLKEGRKLILENQIFKIFLIRFDRMNNEKIINNLKFIRNCSFEYDNFYNEIMCNNAIIISYLMQILYMVNKGNKSVGFVNEQFDKIYFPNFDISKLTSDDINCINDLIIDIFLLFTNHQDAITEMKNKNLKQIVEIIEDNDYIKGNENLKDRLLVIKNYLNN